MPEPQENVTARLVIRKARRPVRRRAGVQAFDIVAGVLSILLALAAIGMVPLILFTSLSGGFGWLAAFFAYLSYCAMDRMGTDKETG